MEGDLSNACQTKQTEQGENESNSSSLTFGFTDTTELANKVATQNLATLQNVAATMAPEHDRPDSVAELRRLYCSSYCTVTVPVLFQERIQQMNHYTWLTINSSARTQIMCSC